MSETTDALSSNAPEEVLTDIETASHQQMITMLFGGGMEGWKTTDGRNYSRNVPAPKGKTFTWHDFKYIERWLVTHVKLMDAKVTFNHSELFINTTKAGIGSIERDFGIGQSDAGALPQRLEARLIRDEVINHPQAILREKLRNALFDPSVPWEATTSGADKRCFERRVNLQAVQNAKTPYSRDLIVRAAREVFEQYTPLDASSLEVEELYRSPLPSELIFRLPYDKGQALRDAYEQHKVTQPHPNNVVHLGKLAVEPIVLGATTTARQ